MARLFADENFPLPVVAALRAVGHDVVTIQEMGEAGRSVPDEEVLARATDDGRAVLTLNRKHFFGLHRKRPEHAGIVACTFDPDFARQAARIDAALQGAGALRGQVIRVNRPDR
jgi:hypothetical protein